MGIGVLFRGQSGRDVKSTTPACSADFRNEWNYTTAPPICLQGVDRDNIFNFKRQRITQFISCMYARRYGLFFDTCGHFDLNAGRRMVLYSEKQLGKVMVSQPALAWLKVRYYAEVLVCSRTFDGRKYLSLFLPYMAISW
jgi:hypothetical protein